MKPNVLICGQTGVGKSSVVNFLFEKNVADIGNSGEACTRGVKFCEGELLNIYDSEGYEIGEEKQSWYKTMLEEFLRTKTGADAVQVVWYAISGAGNRYTSLDLEIIRNLSEKKYAVCVLLTKIDEMEESQMDAMYNDLSRDISPLNIFKTSNQKSVQTFCDWNKLTIWTCTAWQAIDTARTAKLQRLDKMRERAGVTVRTAAAEAARSASIGFGDAFLLLPIQNMLFQVAYLYDIHWGNGIDTSVLKKVLTAARSAVTNNMATVVRTALAITIPVIGPIVYTATNASNASKEAGIITTAIGNALIAFCHKQQQDILEGKSNVHYMEELASKDFIKQVMDNVRKEKQKEKSK